jgi:hypothetical protein
MLKKEKFQLSPKDKSDYTSLKERPNDKRGIRKDPMVACESEIS